MSARIPDFVDPWRLAERGKWLAGEIELSRLARLAEVLMMGTGAATFELRFEMDSLKRPRITGFVRATLTLECQRCLEQMTYPVDAALDLAVIELESEAELLPEGCEPVLAEEGRIRIPVLVEDELLLSLPQVAHHDPRFCSPDAVPTLPAHMSADDEDDEVEKVNPFAVLAGLKSDKQI